MEKQTFLASNFLNRHDLEDLIKSKCGVDIKKNEEAGHKVVGTKKQLKQFQLSDTTSIWGVKCVITDKTLQKSLIEKLAKKGKTWK